MQKKKVTEKEIDKVYYPARNKILKVLKQASADITKQYAIVRTIAECLRIQMITGENIFKKDGS